VNQIFSRILAVVGDATGDEGTIPGGGCPDQPLPLPVWVGNVKPFTKSQTTKIESRRYLCPRFRVAVEAPVTVKQCYAITVRNENRGTGHAMLADGRVKSPRVSYLEQYRFWCWKAQGARHKSVDSCTAPPRSEHQRRNHAGDPKPWLSPLAILTDYCLAAKERRAKRAGWL
jgi:hypothetical protein